MPQATITVSRINRNGRGKRKTAPQSKAIDDRKQKSVPPEACRLHVCYMNAPHTRHLRRNNAYYTHDGTAEEPGAVLENVVATWSYAVRVSALERLETLALIPMMAKWVDFLSVKRKVKDTERRLSRG